MPKPSGRPNWKKQYNEHDNRVPTDSSRRVQFKHNRFNKNNVQKDWTSSIRAHLEEEDVDMGSTSMGGFKRNFNFKRGGGGGPGANKTFKPKLLESPSGWYKVLLPYGNKYEKNYILKLILDNVAPIAFTPITWSVKGTSVAFYVDDFKLAEKLFGLNKQLQMPDGFRLMVRVYGGTPNVDINASLKEKIKLAMAKRYSSENNALNLAKFHADPELQDVFCALFKPIVMMAVIDLIAENIPHLQALNIEHNKIQLLDHLKRVPKKLPNVKILHMGNNKIRDIVALDNLMGLPIVDLVLDGNPLCDKYRDKDQYISEVRKRFPKVAKLDGLDLPPPIGFDISEEVELPSPQRIFMCNPEGQEMATRFLNQYLQIFDEDSRQPLLQAYHEKSMFSMTSCYSYGQHPKNSSWLNWYNTDSRNLLRIQEKERRCKLLRQGHLSIVSFLAEMPSTKHDLNSLTFDLNLCTPQMMLLSISGMFKEFGTGQKAAPVRHFFRTWVIVPAGTGLCIANEELHITNATDQQFRESFKDPPIAASTPIVQSPASSRPQSLVSSPVAAAPIVPDENTKQQMIETMAQQSGMNLLWSQKCLEESEWNFDRAAFAFSQLHTKGAIPAEAFIK